MKYNTRHMNIAPKTCLFFTTPILKIETLSDLAGNVWNILLKVIVENAIAAPNAGETLLPKYCEKITAMLIIIPLIKITALVPPCNIPSLISLGGLFIVSGYAASKANAIAGKESLIRLMNKSCKVVNGFSQFITTANTIAIMAARFPAKR